MIEFDMRAFRDDYATIEDIERWAWSVMDSRLPDFNIGGDYMDRWFIIPRNELQNLYLHQTYRSDDDVMHDHPWDSTSLIIKGGYREQTPDGEYIRKPGDVVHRKAHDAHRLELLHGPSVSLFFTGPKIREWGFHCPNGWVHWMNFTNGKHGARGEKGAGCGEP